MLATYGAYTCTVPGCPLHEGGLRWAGSEDDEPSTRCPECYGLGVPAEDSSGSSTRQAA